MAKGLRKQLAAAQARVADGNESIARLRAVVDYLKRNNAPTYKQEQDLNVLMVRQRLNVVELNRLIELATPAVPVTANVVPFAGSPAL